MVVQVQLRNRPIIFNTVLNFDSNHRLFRRVPELLELMFLDERAVIDKHENDFPMIVRFYTMLYNVRSLCAQTSKEKEIDRTLGRLNEKKKP